MGLLTLAVRHFVSRLIYVREAEIAILTDFTIFGSVYDQGRIPYVTEFFTIGTFKS